MAAIKDNVAVKEHANPMHINRETVLFLSQSITTLINTNTFAIPSDMTANIAVVVIRN